MTKFQIEDGFLTSSAFEELWSSLRALRYQFQGDVWSRAWGLGESPPVASDTFLASDLPIGDGLDLLFEKIAKSIHTSTLFGTNGVDWDQIGFRVFIHSRGSRLLPHSDSPKYVGAAVFYAHPKWSALWGGELLFPDTDFITEDAAYDGQFLDQAVDRSILSSGIGAYVCPKPNRLVLIKGGTWHMTNRVDADAGANMRCTVCAFVYKKVQAHEDVTNIEVE